MYRLLPKVDDTAPSFAYMNLASVPVPPIASLLSPFGYSEPNLFHRTYTFYQLTLLVYAFHPSIPPWLLLLLLTMNNSHKDERTG